MTQVKERVRGAGKLGLAYRRNELFTAVFREKPTPSVAPTPLRAAPT
jgi:hypothetical protein